MKIIIFIGTIICIIYDDIIVIIANDLKLMNNKYVLHL